MPNRSRAALVLAVFAVLLAATPHAQAPLRATVHASGFTNPVALVQDPVDRSVQFVVEQGGRVRTVRSGTIQAADFLDLRDRVRAGGEQGLLGMVFAPDAATSGRFFVNYTNASGHTVIARFRRSSDPLIAERASAFELRWGPELRPFIAQPYSNHNGGHLAFGPDGFLYIGLGDGGSGNDPEHRAQDPRELLGKMLRIDVRVADTHPSGYVVPPGNPFVAGGPAGTRPEIWSFGWRNPWRYSFDDVTRGGTGALIVADVGQNGWEEVDYEPRGRGGRNYGWRNREGAHDNANVTPLEPAFRPLTDPVHEYDHSVGSSITGGYVYRGNALGAAYRGRYFFADFVRSRVWSAALAIDQGSGEAAVSGVIEHTADFGGAARLGGVASFGVDADGELYLVSYSGTVFRILTAAPSAPTGLRIIRSAG